MASPFPKAADDPILGPSLDAAAPSSSKSPFPRAEDDPLLGPSLKGPTKGEQPISDWDGWHQMLDAAVFGKYSDWGGETTKKAKADWVKEHPGKAKAGDLVGRSLPMMAIGAAASVALPEIGAAVGLGTLGRFLAGTFGESTMARLGSMAAQGGWQGWLGAKINNLVGAEPKENELGSALAGGITGPVGGWLTSPLRSGITANTAQLASNYMRQGGMRLTPAQVPGAPSAVRGLGRLGSLFGLGSGDLPRLTKGLMKSIGDEDGVFTETGVQRARAAINQRLNNARAAGDLQGVRLANSQLANADVLEQLARDGGNTGVVDAGALARAVSARDAVAQGPSLGALSTAARNPVNINALAQGGEVFARQPVGSISSVVSNPKVWGPTAAGALVGEHAWPLAQSAMEYAPHGLVEGASLLGGTALGAYGGVASLMNNPIYMRMLLSKYLPTVNPLVSPAQQILGNKPFGSLVGSANAMTNTRADQSGWEDYIRTAAQKRGIDPDVAVRVARTEGLGDSYAGDEGSSFGPYQLHYGGIAGGGNRVSGLGDVFTKTTGLHARDPQTVPQQIDFALDYARANGWGPWHGWKGDQFEGIPKGLQVRAGPTSSGLTSVLQPITGPGPSQDEIANALGGGGQ